VPARCVNRHRSIRPHWRKLFIELLDRMLAGGAMSKHKYPKRSLALAIANNPDWFENRDDMVYLKR
jgi:hypothetical protein